jgi:hypothetical protein
MPKLPFGVGRDEKNTKEKKSNTQQQLTAEVIVLLIKKMGHIQGCQIKILQIGILLPEFGKFREKYLVIRKRFEK